MISGRIAFNIFLLAIASAGVVKARQLPDFGQIGPGDFPMWIAGLGVIVLLCILLQDVRQLVNDNVVNETTVTRFQALGLGLIVLMLAAYITGLEWLGFLPSTGIFLFLAAIVSTWMLDPPKQTQEWHRLAAFSALYAAIATGASYYAFTKGFGLVFP